MSPDHATTLARQEDDGRQLFGQRWWVTGARGFIGRYVLKQLRRQGALVAGLGHGAWPQDEAERAGLQLWRNGVVEPDNLDALATAHGLPAVVVHLAGGSAVGPSFEQPAEDFRRTVVAVQALAEWVRLRSPRTRLVMASSAAVYGDGHSGPIAESSACKPFSPYGFHKRMAELALEGHARSFGLQVAIVRLFSVYGPGLRKQLLWDVCNRLLRQPNVLSLGGSGRELRDWFHVEDAARLLVESARHASTQPWVVNGGTGEAATVADVAQAVVRAMRLPAAVQFSGLSRSGDPQCLVADVRRLSGTGFSPIHQWGKGIQDYVDWFMPRQKSLQGDVV